ncbi:hypothetical protein AB0395_45070 [Streptosporangium sp. NPDC051023]|uniref:hypothetical protein n=1 Tax=Streptosporangium sp. NPDC051023 TaxID=3155410 RepID=UPI00344F9F93
MLGAVGGVVCPPVLDGAGRDRPPGPHARPRCRSGAGGHAAPDDGAKRYRRTIG